MTSEMYPVIDLFAGPGGLSEGFSALIGGKRRFEVRLSIEKDEFAYQTLSLRAFFRSFSRGAPDAYYEHLRGEISREDLLAAFPKNAKLAADHAWKAELGVEPDARVHGRISGVLGGAEKWVLIGGPPCQAYSLAGRSRNRGVKGYSAEGDHRHYLYREYLKTLAKLWPPVFVMENVKGILSAEVGGERIFHRICDDLREPARALRIRGSAKKYRLCPLVASEGASGSLFGDEEDDDPGRFLIKMEDYGVPQARHRIILLGVREDYCGRPAPTLERCEPVELEKVLLGCPPIRSGLSRAEDSETEWRRALETIAESAWLGKRAASNNGVRQTARLIRETVRNVAVPKDGRGGEFVACTPKVGYEKEWYLDKRLGGVCNHSSRQHIAADLQRYLYAATFALAQGRSPKIVDFPMELLPLHRNVSKAIYEHGNFNDRFRVQVGDRPATTITSHIRKDGHYYIHPDPKQCRSLTVREAARIQTFPDNYFFCGPRTAQYGQVGNAVPPMLANRIGRIVSKILESR